MNGKGRIWIDATAGRENGGRMVSVVIGNDGPVIPADALARIFDEFYTTGKAGGTGLGLSIVKKIVEQHGGNVWCRSADKIGTEFGFLIPVASQPIDSDTVDAADIRQVGLNEQHGLHGKEVTIIDDDIYVLESWSTKLSNVRLNEFRSSADFWSTVEHDKAFPSRQACFIIDYFFDGEEVTGSEIATRLRGLTDAPIFLCSNAEIVDDANLGAVDGFLRKELVSAVELEQMLAKVRVRRMLSGEGGPESGRSKS